MECTSPPDQLGFLPRPNPNQLLSCCRQKVENSLVSDRLVPANNFQYQIKAAATRKYDRGHQRNDEGEESGEWW